MRTLRSNDRDLIEAANMAYHEAEASLYDTAHPEILWCERAHWETFAERYLSQPRGPRRILDIGAGTGFIGSVFSPALRSGDCYIAADISPEMLGVLKRKLKRCPARVEACVASSDRLPYKSASFDIVTIDSALHHFPDAEGSLREAIRLVAPGGVLAIMHEPNIRFARSWFLCQLARIAWVIASRLDPLGAPRPDYGPVFAHVNDRLRSQNRIDGPLSPREIQALVDVHSPTARGRYEEVGFDPLSWLKGMFRTWDAELFQTYNYLGKLDPSKVPWRRSIEKVLAFICPSRGFLFSLVVRKFQNF